MKQEGGCRIRRHTCYLGEHLLGLMSNQLASSQVNNSSRRVQQQVIRVKVSTRDRESWVCSANLFDPCEEG